MNNNWWGGGSGWPVPGGPYQDYSQPRYNSGFFDGNQNQPAWQGDTWVQFQPHGNGYYRFSPQNPPFQPQIQPPQRNFGPGPPQFANNQWGPGSDPYRPPLLPNPHWASNPKSPINNLRNLPSQKSLPLPTTSNPVPATRTNATVTSESRPRPMLTAVTISQAFSQVLGGSRQDSTSNNLTSISVSNTGTAPTYSTISNSNQANNPPQASTNLLNPRKATGTGAQNPLPATTAPAKDPLKEYLIRAASMGSTNVPTQSGSSMPQTPNSSISSQASHPSISRVTTSASTSAITITAAVSSGHLTIRTTNEQPGRPTVISQSLAGTASVNKVSAQPALSSPRVNQSPILVDLTTPSPRPVSQVAQPRAPEIRPQRTSPPEPERQIVQPVVRPAVGAGAVRPSCFDARSVITNSRSVKQGQPVVPCEIYTSERCFIQTKYLSPELRPLLDAIPNTQWVPRDGRWYFNRNQHSSVAGVLASRSPPVFIGPPMFSLAFSRDSGSSRPPPVNCNKEPVIAHGLGTSPSALANDTSSNCITCYAMNDQRFMFNTHGLAPEMISRLTKIPSAHHNVMGSKMHFPNQYYEAVEDLTNADRYCLTGYKPNITVPHRRTLPDLLVAGHTKQRQTAPDRIQAVTSEIRQPSLPRSVQPPLPLLAPVSRPPLMPRSVQPPLPLLAPVSRPPVLPRPVQPPLPLQAAPISGPPLLPRSVQPPLPLQAAPISRPPLPAGVPLQLASPISNDISSRGYAPKRNPVHFPGYDILEHYVAPNFMFTDANLTGVFSALARISLPNTFDPNHYTEDTGKAVVLRMVYARSNVPVWNTTKTMELSSIKFNDVPATLTMGKEKYQFTIDITPALRGGTENIIKTLARLKNCESNDRIVLSIALGRQLTVAEKLVDLIANASVAKDITRKMITDEMNEVREEGISIEPSLQATFLTCPLGKGKIVYPCRGARCKHYRCFDAKNFLDVQRLCRCPFCDIELDYEDLIIDSYFDEVLKSINGDVKDTRVKLDVNGNFTVCSTQRQTEEIALSDDEDVVNLSDDELFNSVKPFPIKYEDSGLLPDLSVSRADDNMTEPGTSVMPGVPATVSSSSYSTGSTIFSVEDISPESSNFAKQRSTPPTDAVPTLIDDEDDEVEIHYSGLSSSSKNSYATAMTTADDPMLNLARVDTETDIITIDLSDDEGECISSPYELVDGSQSLASPMHGDLPPSELVTNKAVNSNPQLPAKVMPSNGSRLDPDPNEQASISYSSSLLNSSGTDSDDNVEDDRTVILSRPPAPLPTSREVAPLRLRVTLPSKEISAKQGFSRAPAKEKHLSSSSKIKEKMRRDQSGNSTKKKSLHISKDTAGALTHKSATSAVPNRAKGAANIISICEEFNTFNFKERNAVKSKNSGLPKKVLSMQALPEKRDNGPSDSNLNSRLEEDPTSSSNGNQKNVSKTFQPVIAPFAETATKDTKVRGKKNARSRPNRRKYNVDDSSTSDEDFEISSGTEDESSSNSSELCETSLSSTSEDSVTSSLSTSSNSIFVDSPLIERSEESPDSLKSAKERAKQQNYLKYLVESQYVTVDLKRISERKIRKMMITSKPSHNRYHTAESRKKQASDSGNSSSDSSSSPETHVDHNKRICSCSCSKLRKSVNNMKDLIENTCCRCCDKSRSQSHKKLPREFKHSKPVYGNSSTSDHDSSPSESQHSGRKSRGKVQRKRRRTTSEDKVKRPVKRQKSDKPPLSNLAKGIMRMW